eukprot:CAMPEP_0113626566 /NCGR_PEP_ID=MMETSP0017_2-20120614/13741_1 /TAXON_ID=2856 /ORGANISM="Cylindrotheca closterium" /LENGTH=215 /DNA_ID=CAMNT_0000536755 /DNA_START=108 /DNA_END=756 /DNA_ORIENTATION=+ /assembly_acc=CAM_ASM_000147
MKFITPTILALASTPATTNAWSMGGGPYFTKQIYVPVPSAANTMMRRKRALANKFFQETQLASPRYELVDNEDKFQVSVDVPGVKMEDIDVSLEDGYLTVSGQRLTSNDNSRFTSKFPKLFSLDAAVNVEQFSANLDNGVLVVMAPKDMKRIEENITKIPVVQGKSEAEVEDNVEVEEVFLADEGNEEDDAGTLDRDTTDVEASGDDTEAESTSA